MIYIKMPEGKHYRETPDKPLEMQGEYLVTRRGHWLYFECLNGFLGAIIKVSGL